MHAQNTVQDILFVLEQTQKYNQNILDFSNKVDLELTESSKQDKNLYIDQYCEEFASPEINQKDLLKKNMQFHTLNTCNELGFKLKKHKFQNFWVEWGDKDQVCCDKSSLNSKLRFNETRKSHISIPFFDQKSRPQRWFYADKKQLIQVLLNRKSCPNGSQSYLKSLFPREQHISENRVEFLLSLIKIQIRENGKLNSLFIEKQKLEQYNNTLNNIKNCLQNNIDPLTQMNELNEQQNQQMGQDLTKIEESVLQKVIQNQNRWVLPQGAEYINKTDFQPDGLKTNMGYCFPDSDYIQDRECKVCYPLKQICEKKIQKIDTLAYQTSELKKAIGSKFRKDVLIDLIENFY